MTLAATFPRKHITRQPSFPLIILSIHAAKGTYKGCGGRLPYRGLH